MALGRNVTEELFKSPIILYTIDMSMRFYKIADKIVSAYTLFHKTRILFSLKQVHMMYM